MKSRISIVVWALMTLPLLAHASCEAVKSDIDAKIKANGVSNYSLDVMDANQASSSEGKVVGQCEGNKAIVYSRGLSKISDGNPNNAPKDSSSATTVPDSTPKVQAPAPARSGQTGG